MTAMLPMTMAGHDRAYRPPRALRTKAADAMGDSHDAVCSRVAAGAVDGWDLFTLERRDDFADWARSTLAGLVAAADADADAAIGCTDCTDTGFYGLIASDNSDLLTGLVRRVGDGLHERLCADGTWKEWDHAESDGPLEVLDLDLAGDLASALTAGACGLLRRYCVPQYFLPPTSVIASAPLGDFVSQESTLTPHGEWVNYAIVDNMDPGAVLDLVRVRGDQAQRMVDGQWADDDDVLLDDAIPVVRLGDELLASLVADAPLTVSPDPRAEKLRRYWSTGKGAAKIRWNTPGDWKRCYRHLKKYMGLRAKGYCQNLHKRDTGVWTGSRFNVGGNGHHHGKLLASITNEQALMSSLRSGQWTGNQEGTTAMAEIAVLDGIYSEVSDESEGLMRTLVAGGFPVAPKDEWFQDPQLASATPLTITDDGQVYGHIATWGTAHIGYQGQKVTAPRSASGYAYYCLKQAVSASGKTYNVGNLTLSGGHADIRASAEQAVAHYDNTNSAVADVTAGEDKHGIWVAGSLRPDVTPEQLRVLRASAPSGDWRPINGHLELVAVCQVNVPGFPVARARVASGAITALVAAGARELAVIKASMTADAAVLERLAAVETQVAALGQPGEVSLEVLPVEAAVVGELQATEAPTVAVESPAEAVAEPVAVETPAAPVEEAPAAAEDTVSAPAEAAEDVVVPDTAETVTEVTPTAAAERASALEAARASVAAVKRDLLRAEMHSVTAAVPPQFLKNQKGKKGAVERKGGGYPISDEASLKDAIQAFGRAKPEDKAKTKAHIISAAKKLGLSNLIPDGWK